MITADNLSAGYGSGTVLNDLTFTLAGGLVHGLIGPNGAGKTTLLRVLAGQLKQSGELIIGSAGAPFDNPAVMDHTVLAGIDTPIPHSWTASRFFRLGAGRYESWDTQREAELVTAFELPVDKTYDTLSRGQKSAMSFIFAVASGADLLLLDEPYLGLDVEKRDVFYRVIAAERTTERTIVISTHHLHEVGNLLDTVLLLDKDSRVLVNGPADELSERIVEVTGPAADVEAALVGVDKDRIMNRETIATGTRVVVDLAGSRDPGAIYDAAGTRVRVKPVTLEVAVRALQGGQR